VHRILPFEITGRGSIFSPLAWFYVIVTTLANCVVLGMFTATILIVYNTVMR
jgi:hypothetical protein